MDGWPLTYRLLVDGIRVTYVRAEQIAFVPNEVVGGSIFMADESKIPERGDLAADIGVRNGRKDRRRRGSG